MEKKKTKERASGLTEYVPLDFNYFVFLNPLYILLYTYILCYFLCTTTKGLTTFGWRNKKSANIYFVIKKDDRVFNVGGGYEEVITTHV